MGLTAAGTEIVTGTGTGGLSAVATEGIAVGGMFVTIALVYLLTYLDLIDAIDGEYDRLRRVLSTIIVLFGLVFVGIIFLELNAIS
ncbi:hypothetical protein G9464_02830 [Halostella sp. JP-L12]|uniref:hypothetical protein n=1 Tax=Halostella TaxID=1843185 RepID=UPI000EF7AFAF|nr:MULTISPECIES: hypothetical protein [Halostella]NHN46532.1 hypothetical protein [Halostella sp. JP-L12]